MISEEYDTPVKVPHGVVQCRFLDVLDFGVQLCTTYNERFVMYTLECESEDFSIKVVHAIEFSNTHWSERGLPFYSD